MSYTQLFGRVQSFTYSSRDTILGICCDQFFELFIRYNVIHDQTMHKSINKFYKVNRFMSLEYRPASRLREHDLDFRNHSQVSY